ncbi:MAG: hypothetical protein BWY04_00657 [candidate division CPR1 bacterium ADurb.Bin160]|jgi:hypothetical protein|uniref:Uncharacterized protein n=1 Tax=candidate division CPR1 bacterium ADurb.Bin160 TaxID=1852826 RepID=A0A1V5ZNF2_9BACT|nr:MAG: hypothetical protein BWY04_00657 [candidate division CPR1 bacterium ADurb.Bin160]
MNKSSSKKKKLNEQNITIDVDYVEDHMDFLEILEFVEFV